MDPALGVPKELEETPREDLTPMIRQYVELCERYDSSLVLFHVGDFYKAFGEAAETVARLCELTLTSREDTTGEYAMAGLRVDNAETHLETLLDAGYRVAIAEQVEDPAAVSGVADRAVTRIVTPGTLTEAELLESESHNFVACLTQAPAGGSEPAATADAPPFGLALLDVSTGAFYTTSLRSVAAVTDEVNRVDPSEAILGPTVRDHPDVVDSVFAHVDCPLTEYTAEAFDPDVAREKVTSYFGALQGSTLSTVGVRACGALLGYAEFTRGGETGELEYITRLTRYDPAEFMQLDDVALRGLELFERRAEQSPQGATLVDVIDSTVSALGSRKVREWLRRPLLSQDRIESRLTAVEELVADEFTRAAVRDALQNVYDLERLISRIARNRATARDLRSLYDTLGVLPEIRSALADVESPFLTELTDDLALLTDIRDRIDAAIRPDPNAEVTEGGIISDGYHDELDELRSRAAANKEWIAGLEEAERERTGIDNLRVGYTQVHGYYIEVTESHLDEVPDDYTRRQTLKNAERFYTPELKAREDEIITAEHRANDLEYEIFRDVRSSVGAETERVQQVADQLARVDAIAGFAEVAAYNEYTRPEIDPPGSGITIRDGRHPVVERTQETFVPNDTELGDEHSLAVITGPNMSGKSTYLRQIGLITILAQSGCFVPAAAARIGIVDRLFTRIGASDDITGGRSTFMVEMTELADILETATDHSLVLLDEVGRGTSTADGYALACAVTEYVHESVGAKTLFATHHHQLTEYVSTLPRAHNLHFGADQRGDEVVFHYTLEPGPATASYGIEVAREAGVPDRVIDLAQRELALTPDSASGPPESPIRDGDGSGHATASRTQHRSVAELPPEPGEDVLQLLDTYSAETIVAIVSELEAVDIETTTPLDAFETLADLLQRLDDT